MLTPLPHPPYTPAPSQWVAGEPWQLGLLFQRKSNPPWQPRQQPLMGPITPTRAAPVAVGGCQLPREMLRRASLAGASPILQTRVVPHVRTAANDTANYPGMTEGLLIR